MDSTRIIQQGEIAKFKIEIADFDMSGGDFKVELIYGYHRTVVEIDKDQMFADDDNNWYFCFDTDDMVGRVTARCTWYLSDTDTSTEIRPKVDEQFICFVVSNPCPKFITCPACTTSSSVTYTRTEESSVAEYYYRLCDFYHHPLVTADDCYICVLKEAAETAVEEGSINTD